MWAKFNSLMSSFGYRLAPISCDFGAFFWPGQKIKLIQVNKMDSLIDRLKEPSTYAGLAGVALAVGISADEFAGIAAAIAGFFGFIAAIKGE